ncbi:hypothetical protein BH24ACT26_BH24ACT26_12290 [soil metagenome]
MGKEPDRIRQEIEDTRTRMGDTVEAIGYKTDVKSRTKESITNKKDNIVDSVRNTKDSIVGSLVGTKDSMVDSAGNMRDSTASTVSDNTPSGQDMKQGARKAVGVAQENPLGLAVGSFAVGFLAGMVLPSSRVEQEKIGPLAGQVKEKVMETGQEAMDRGKQVAQETAQVARDAAQEAVQKTAQAAKETGQQQGEELASSAQQKAQETSPTRGN